MSAAKKELDNLVIWICHKGGWKNPECGYFGGAPINRNQSDLRHEEMQRRLKNVVQLVEQEDNKNNGRK